MAKKSRIPVSRMQETFRSQGAARVSPKAAAELCELCESLIVNICEEAGRLAEHSGKATIREKDIALAAKKVMVK